MSKPPEPVEFVIRGEPASKANSRKFVLIKGKPRIIKSQKARNYTFDFKLQCPLLRKLFLGDVCVEMRIWYASRRPDLDESVILDAMQGRIYINDRQVKRKVVDWDIDPEDPRTWIRVSALAGGHRSSDK